MATFEENDFEVSVDLRKACEHQLFFLGLVDSHRFLYEEGAVKRAIWRYEKFWLPLASEHNGKEEIVPPLDVHWVWHTHMLAPHYYRRDCMNIVGRVIPHKLLSEKEYNEAIKHTEQMWKLKYEEPFHLDIDQPVADFSENDASQISYDIIGAVSRQKEFYYQVSLPHFKDHKFITNGILRYKMLLFIKKTYPTEFVVPCYDSDLAWHSHQLHPQQYYEDTSRILGQMFNHDDNVTDRSPGSKLATADDRTRELWSQHFGNSYVCNGAMYRGERHLGLLKQTPKELKSSTCYKTVHIRLEQVKLNDNSSTFDKKSRITFALESKAAKHQILKLKGPTKTWSAQPLVKFPYDTHTNTGLYVGITRKSGPWVFGAKEFLGEAEIDLTSGLNSLKDESYTKSMQVPIKKSLYGSKGEESATVSTHFNLFT